MFEICNIKNQKELYETTKKNFTGNVKIETPHTIDGEEIAALKAKTFCLELNDEKETTN